MRNVTVVLMIAVVCAVISGCASPGDKQEFVELFNGEDLTGWGIVDQFYFLGDLIF